jgi:hypothetical protein
VPDRRAPALVCAIAAPIAALLLCGAYLGVSPGTGPRRGGPDRAIILFRDHVPAYQELGTLVFAQGVLGGAYDHSIIMGQAQRFDDAHLVGRIEEVLRQHQVVDLFLLAHGNRIVDRVRSIDPDLRSHLRLVYNSGCRNASQSSEWLALGADSYVGHEARHSLSPAFFYFFARSWSRGAMLDDAVKDANERSQRRLELFGMGSSRESARAQLTGRKALSIDREPR